MNKQDQPAEQRDSFYAVVFALALGVVLISGLLVPVWRHAFSFAGVTAILSLGVATFRVLSKHAHDLGGFLTRAGAGGVATVAAVCGVALVAVTIPEELIAKLPPPDTLLASSLRLHAYAGTATTFYVVNVVGLIAMLTLPFLLVYFAMDILPKGSKRLPWVMLFAAFVFSGGVLYFAKNPSTELLIQLLLIIAAVVVATWVFFLCLLLEEGHIKVMHDQRLLGVGLPIIFGVANVVTIVQGFTGLLEHFEYLTPVAICGIGVCGIVVLIQLVFLTIYIPRGIQRGSATHYLLAGSIALSIASVVLIAMAEFLGNVLPTKTVPPASATSSSVHPAVLVCDAERSLQPNSTFDVHTLVLVGHHFCQKPQCPIYVWPPSVHEETLVPLTAG